ncbi:PREDICTED: proline-rich protein HaeIII subfamily 1-like [Hipposideros armiger]|uniref:Proline-rich protein HaeIII subfamily 1-like n=1 Tax=Hipposideros armiger TaxID=186990 RepID=A0A8B7QQ80_HIPAR|nr:PREDICTED: proline-rich protein HaeIII subfamily 1-like [Hipposideros armiger]
MSVPGAPSIKLLVGSLLLFPTVRLPGRGARPPPPAPHRGSSAISGGLASRGRRCGCLEPGGARLFPPRGPLAAAGQAHWAGRRDPRAGPAPSSLEPSGSLPKRPALLKPGRGCEEPPRPQVRAGPRPCPGPAVLGPSSPRPGARPWPGGPALRTREGTRQLPRGALTHRPHCSSPWAPPPPELLAARHPDQVPTPETPARALGDLAPGGLGGNPHAGHAPRGRASAPGRGERAGPSGQRARRRPWRWGMRTACPF